MPNPVRRVVAVEPKAFLIALGLFVICFTSPNPAIPALPHAPQLQRRADAIPVNVSRYGFRELIDSETGVQLGIPFEIVGGAKPSSWGNTWSASDGRLRIATLNFHGKRTLRSVYETIRGRKGRRISRDSYDGHNFILEGSDADGMFFHVQANERHGEVRGISITYEGSAKTELALVVSSIAQSYRAFPAAADHELRTGESGTSSDSGQGQAAASQRECAAETENLRRLAARLSADITIPAEVKAGGAFGFKWHTSQRFPSRTPAYLVLAVPGEVR